MGDQNPSVKWDRRKNIVLVGGGSGNRATLTGLKNQDCYLSAVVAMTDSDGSSGRLRAELGQLPHGAVNSTRHRPTRNRHSLARPRSGTTSP